MSALFLYTTAPDAATAKAIAAALVERRLAACVNILGASTSVYRWKGAVETAEETTFIVKTTEAAAGAARRLILTLHPYETPCIAALAISESHSHGDFIAWIASETDPNYNP